MVKLIFITLMTNHTSLNINRNVFFKFIVKVYCRHLLLINCTKRLELAWSVNTKFQRFSCTKWPRFVMENLPCYWKFLILQSEWWNVESLLKTIKFERIAFGCHTTIRKILVISCFSNINVSGARNNKKF